MCRKLQFEEKFQVAAPVNVKIQYCNAFLLFKKKRNISFIQNMIILIIIIYIRIKNIHSLTEKREKIKNENDTSTLSEDKKAVDDETQDLSLILH